MKNRYIVWILSSAICLAGSLPMAFAQTVPERLLYQLSWSGINVGTATQEIIEEGGVRRITSLARSDDWLSLFFPVEDRVESVLAKAQAPFPGVSKRYRMQIREGKHRRDREILFDQGSRKARYLDHLSGEKAEVTIGANTFDIGGSFYYARYAPLEVGKSIHITVLDGKTANHLEVRVLRKEKIDSVLGEVGTIVISPLVRPEGLFEGKGNVLIWLTDDTRRIPVKVRTKVRAGYVTATLVGRNHNAEIIPPP